MSKKHEKTVRCKKEKYVLKCVKKKPIKNNTTRKNTPNYLQINNGFIQNQRHAVLFLYVNNKNPELKSLYKKHIEKHNKDFKHNPHLNSGFDIFIPEEIVIKSSSGKKNKHVDLEIKVEMFDVEYKMNSDVDNENPVKTMTSTAFYVYPRSSFARSPLILSNKVGIIDSGCRDYLFGSFKLLSDDKKEHTIKKHSKLLQICHPLLLPIYVEMKERDECI